MPNHRSLLFPILSLSLFLSTIANAVSSFAEPGSVGEAVGFEHELVGGPRWWEECTDDRGITARLEPRCSESYCPHPTNFYLQRYDAADRPVGPRMQVNTAPGSIRSQRVTCSPGGWLVVQWRNKSFDCYHHRIFDPDTKAATVPIQTFADDQLCRIRPTIAVDDGGGFLSVWPQIMSISDSVLLARRYGGNGHPRGEVAQVSEDTSARAWHPKIVRDGVDAILVVWSERSQGSDRIVARYFDTALAAIGPSFRVDNHAHGVPSDPALRLDRGGNPVVVWTNALYGGRVARRVARDISSIQLGGARAVTAGSGYGAARTIDSQLGFTRDPSALELSAGRGWLISTDSTDYSYADHTATYWSAPRAVADGRYLLDAGASELQGVALLLDVGSQDKAAIEVSVSADAATTWSEPSRVYALSAVAPSSVRGAVSSAASSWIALWSTEDGETIQAVRSIDAGASWSSPAVVSRGSGAGTRGLQLVGDGSGTWITVWADQGLRFSRSADDGRTWSPSRSIADDLVCTTCGRHRHYTSISLVASGDGRWGVAFASPMVDSARFGHDGDVFIAVSDDDGRSWSAPSAVASYAGDDGERDYNPSLVARGDAWTLAWSSHRMQGAGDGLDADIVYATSSDAGRSWSAPVRIDDRALDDPITDTDARLAVDDHGAMIAVWHAVPFEDTPPGVFEIRVLAAAAGSQCGNRRAEFAELCDDGNRIDGDGCDSDCTTSDCGNGIRTAGEACDDGNRRNDDACVAECSAAECGDGYLFTGMEHCDDANTDDDDGCASSCTIPACGDGIVQLGAEDCDDGNDRDDDACLNDCTAAACGDGVRWHGEEGCDDGNTLDDDNCPNDCGVAVCGDGVTSYGFEHCDPTDPYYADICTEDCQLKGLCGDFDGDGTVAVSDARGILVHAVGLTKNCPHNRCDIDGDGRVVVTDAHLALRQTVGEDIEGLCSIGSGTIVFWIADQREIGAFQFDVHYGATGGHFLGSAADVECTVAPDLADRVIFAAYDYEFGGVLSVGLATTNGFHGPIDLVQCVFELPRDGSNMDAGLSVYVVDASGLDGPLLPTPRIGYSLIRP